MWEPPGDLEVATIWRAIETAADQVSLGIFVVEISPPGPRLVYCSDRAARLVGRSRAELIGAPPWAALGIAEQALVRDLIATRDGNAPASLELAVARPDGRVVPVELGFTRMRTERRVLSLGYLRDLSTERDALAALRQSEQRFRFLVEAAPDGVAIVRGGEIVFINAMAASMLGTDIAHALGSPITSYLPPADAAQARARTAELARAGRELPTVEYRVLADPERVLELKSIHCEWEGGPAMLAFARDVTQRKALEARLAVADRLAALGTLAAGIAHEINNPLTYVQLSLQRVERALAEAGLSEEIARAIGGHLADVQQGITRVASIATSLRTFARADDAPPGPVELIPTIESALKMVDNDLRHRAQLVRELEGAPVVIANASRLEQVFVNLLINAIQAIPADDAARQQIALSVTSSGGAVAIAIRDTGRGIPSHLAARVFDPFFTTKPIGEGTGIGLAISKSIVESFGGRIELESREGAGTTVTVTLRSSTASGTLRALTNGADHEPAEPVVDARRVLVIDDDVLVRRALANLLGRHHDVTSVASGTAAIEEVAAHRFDAILCDMMMPGMTGLELYRRIALDHPGLEQKIVFITGGTVAPRLEEFLSTSGNRCLVKPFTLESILDAIAEV